MVCLKILKGFSNNYREAEEDGPGRKLERESWKQNKHRKIWVHGVLRRTVKEEWERFKIRVGNLGKGNFWTSVARPETPTKTRSWILEILWKSVAIVYSCKLSLWITGDDMD
ncbi:hypothetical protein F2Q70_00040043 [Brassica cretica]|uniref:Uncharacterized protein n=1 Tax=Brassica cretica TaxID=69181 RepID=A0A8S9K7S4_BRACR|nr:hypothetical protein F2Q70_00040043 [Brassica cretica]